MGTEEKICETLPPAAGRADSVSSCSSRRAKERSGSALSGLVSGFDTRGAWARLWPGSCLRLLSCSPGFIDSMGTPSAQCSHEKRFAVSSDWNNLHRDNLHRDDLHWYAWQPMVGGGREPGSAAVFRIELYASISPQMDTWRSAKGKARCSVFCMGQRSGNESLAEAGGRVNRQLRPGPARSLQASRTEQTEWLRARKEAAR